MRRSMLTLVFLSFALGAAGCAMCPASPAKGKFVIILQAGTESHEGLVRAVHALLYSAELLEAGHEVVLIFDGAGTEWARALRKPKHKLHARHKRLADLGARIQNPLWASTSTKSPDYPDTLYVQDLIGPHCVNTIPDDTIVAYRDHGEPRVTLTDDAIARGERVLETLAEVGVDLDDITLNALVKEGVEKFEISYRELLDTIAVAAKG